MTGFSIIVCTHNPDTHIFGRLLTALRKLNTSGLQYEIIIVDNNSTPEVSKDDRFDPLLRNLPRAKVIKESAPGLTAARIAGIKQAHYEWIIFFDDDNEPAPDYLYEANAFIAKHEQLGICGAGTIEVDFLEHNEETRRQRIITLFQEKKVPEEIISNDLHEGKDEAFPFGTGMIVRKDILAEYSREVADGTFTLRDRTGKSLSSAGDTQILYLALKKGYYSGTSPAIKLKHIIAGKKTTRQAIIKLYYSLHAGHIKAFNEVFTEKPYAVRKISNREILKSFYAELRKRRFKLSSDTLFNISESLGMKKAQIVAGDYETPFLLRLWEKAYKI